MVRSPALKVFQVATIYLQIESWLDLTLTMLIQLASLDRRSKGARSGVDYDLVDRFQKDSDSLGVFGATAEDWRLR